MFQGRIMDRLAAEQARLSAMTRGAWNDYEPHRRIVTEHLIAKRPPGRDRLCVLGAGNANDLDLPRLTATFREVHLVDLDAEALALGVSRQGMLGTPTVYCHEGVDVTGILPRLAAWDPRLPPSDEELTQCVRAAREYGGPNLPGPFDVVASTCLLSQLIDSVVTSLADSHPRFPELLLAVRDRHLRLLVELLVPGGLAVLITDLVSSDTCAELATVADAELSELVARLVAERNFFSGTNPQLIKTWFKQDRSTGGSLAGVYLSRPWRWQVGPRTYAVYAIRAQRA